MQHELAAGRVWNASSPCGSRFEPKNDEVIVDIAMIVGFAAFVVGIIVAVSVYNAQMQKMRRESIQGFANESGLTFWADDIEKLRTRLLDFQLFKEGRAQRAFNVLRAEAEGVSMTVFDYQFTTGSGKSQHTHRLTTLLVEADSLHLPPLTLRPENIFDSIAGVFGFRDIDFENNPEFSRGFVLKSPNEEFTRKLFDQDICQFFMARRDVVLESNRNRFVLYRRNKTVHPRDFKSFMADGLELFNLFSASLVRMEQSERLKSV